MAVPCRADSTRAAAVSEGSCVLAELVATVLRTLSSSVLPVVLASTTNYYRWYYTISTAYRGTLHCTSSSTCTRTCMYFEMVHVYLVLVVVHVRTVLGSLGRSTRAAVQLQYSQ